MTLLPLIEIVHPVDSLWQGHKDVLKGDHNEEQKQEHQTNAMRKTFLSWMKRLATDYLQENKENSPAIQSWQRQ